MISSLYHHDCREILQLHLHGDTARKQFCSFIFYFLSTELKEILIQECVICWFATQNGKIQIVQLMLIVLPETEELLNSAKMP